MSVPSDDDARFSSGSVDDSAEPRFLIVGRILRPHGVRGEVRASVLTDLPERFKWLERIFLSRTEEAAHPAAVALESVRFHKDNVLLKLRGYDNRDQAEALRTFWLMVPETEGIPLDEGEFFLYQLENLAVYTDAGEYLGRIVEILETKANDVFVVHTDAGDLLLPDIEDVVKEINLDAGRMIVTLIPGLRP